MRWRIKGEISVIVVGGYCCVEGNLFQLMMKFSFKYNGFGLVHPDIVVVVSR